MSEKFKTPRNSYVQRTWLFVFILMLPAVMTNSGFAQTESRDSSKPASKEKNAAESLIENTEVLVKITAVKDNAVAANEFIKPDEGNKFVSIQIIIDNTKSESEWETKPDSFKLKDAEGNIYETEASIMGAAKVTQPTLKSGMVDGGDLVKGWITFQVGSTVKVKDLRLRYEDFSYLSESNFKSGWISLSAVLK